MRMFVGIPLAADITPKLSSALSRISLPDADFRKSRPQGWHITLQFLANISQTQLDCILPRLAEVSSPPVPIRIGQIGILGSGMLVAHVQRTPALLSLAEKVMAATTLCGFVAETRPWRPHITLARAKKKGPSRRRLEKSDAHASATLDCEFLAREFFLYESSLGAEGSRYEVRASFPLTGQKRRALESQRTQNLDHLSCP